MLERALADVRRAGLSARIRLAAADACGFDPHELFGVTAFDRILMSYTLSMIPDWRGALREAVRLLAPGGRLLVVDFGQQEGLPDWFRRALFAWLERFHVEPRADLRHELTRLAEEAGGALSFTPRLGGYAWEFVLTCTSPASAAGNGEARREAA
jgi:S-adenosylmethionine-diacylgycerolhomoserine-N-methlytransferase